MKIWVLTEAYNDYDQHGDYLVTVFDHKPTIEDLNNLDGWNVDKLYYDHLINGGGRIKSEESWHYLKELKSGEIYVHSGYLSH